MLSNSYIWLLFAGTALFLFFSLRWIWSIGDNFWDNLRTAEELAQIAETKEELDQAWSRLYKASTYAVNPAMTARVKGVKLLLEYKYKQLKIIKEES